MTLGVHRWRCMAPAVVVALCLQAAHAGDGVLSPELRRLVTDYFRATDAATHQRLLPAIERESGGSTRAVADAMHAVSLWTDPPASRGVIPLHPDSVGPIDVAYRLPAGYDPHTAYGLVLCMPGTRGRGGASAALGEARSALGSRADAFTLVAPTIAIGGSFQNDDPREADLLALLRETRRVFHVDSDRVFLFGARRGADAAWIAAVMHADQFAGVIVVDGYPRVPYADQVYPFLLENLARLPVLSVHRSNAAEPASLRERAVVVHNRAIAALARLRGWPVSTAAIATTAGDSLVNSSDPLDTLLNASRARAPKVVSHWFRYPVEGRESWLSQTRFRGDVWEASQLSIMPPPGARRDPYIAEVMKKHLAYLAGRVEGQTITVETRRCAAVSLFLPMGLIDFAKPVVIRIDGKRRFAGLMTPSIETMLEVARQRWAFSHPVVARMKWRIPRTAKTR